MCNRGDFMIEGKYELTLNTPMGNIPCKIALWKEKDSLSREYGNDGI